MEDMEEITTIEDVVHMMEELMQETLNLDVQSSFVRGDDSWIDDSSDLLMALTEIRDAILEIE